MSMVNKWKKSVEMGKRLVPFLLTYPKAFDCLPHDLTIYKLNAYAFSFLAPRLIQSCFANRKQKTCIVHGKKPFLVFYRVLSWGHIFN